MRFSFFWGIILFVCLSASVYVSAKERMYAIVIGNNASPNDELKPLRFADDDATRFYRYLSRFSDHVYLLTVPDGKTQKRYPMETKRAEIPGERQLNRMVVEVSEAVAAAKASGDTTSFFLFFSGHGIHDASENPALSLYDGALSSDKLLQILKQIDADYVHLFIDACYAEGLVGARGMFDDERESTHREIAEPELRRIYFGMNPLLSLPGLGVMVSSSEQQVAHEWSRIESGIFTYELLSGLSGLADINGDLRIEYSELAAFVAAANRDVSDERGRLRVVAKPPERNYGVPIVVLGESADANLVIQQTAAIGRFSIELENGERYLDANVTDTARVRVLLPSDQKAFLRIGDKEALIDTAKASIVEFDALQFSRPRYREKGAVESALQEGLFQTPFNRSYYKGFIDSVGFQSVSFSDGPLDAPRPFATNIKLRNTLAYSLFGVTAAAAMTAAVFGGLTLKILDDYRDTDYEKASVQINERYGIYTTGFWVAVGIAPVAAICGFLMLPKEEKRRGENTPRVSFHGVGSGLFSVDIRF